MTSPPGRAWLSRLFCWGLFCWGLAPGLARADWSGPRDVERARAVLVAGEASSEARLRAARWLGAYGTDERAVPALLTALELERDVGVASAIAEALARRARAEDAEALLRLLPSVPAAARGWVRVALARLGAEDSDAWLVAWLASPVGPESSDATALAEAIARSRRDALLPRVLEALGDTPSPRLVAWLASLDDERARSTLEQLALEPGAPASVSAVAIAGLARLGPSPRTARALERWLADEAHAASPALGGALLAADPDASVERLLDPRDPLLRAATLRELVRRAPARAVALLGEDPSRLEGDDRVALLEALRSPAAPLAPWLEATLRDGSRSEEEREAALEALVRVPDCALSLDGLALPSLALADARLARACPARALAPAIEADERPEALLLRAIAGRDVSRPIARRFAAASPEARLVLAHAWLASPIADERVIDALAAETDPEVFAVLALAAYAHGLSVAPSRLVLALERDATLAPALAVLARGDEPLPPRVLRVVERALGGGGDERAALALLALGRRGDDRARAHACAALDAPARAPARAARVALLALGGAPCLTRRARIDPLLLGASAEEPTPSGRTAPLVLQVSSNVGGALLRVRIEAADGACFLVRPPPSGIVVVPLPEAEVRLVLDADRLEPRFEH